ncbi:MAG: hypothetical protein EA397_01995 [Deltaproteobacteria bacterium]|nr:MAG: hypothetical protein EA397_01995 [Deltaproteobacteria bacterium]
MIGLFLTALASATPVSSEPLAPGPYVMLVDVASRSEIAFAGKTEVLTRSLLRVDLRASSEGLEVHQEVCDVRIISDSKARTEIPESFITSIPPQRYTATLRPMKDGRWRFQADPGPSVVGFQPEEGQEELPTRRGDSRVTDPDGDGYPGVTVRLHTPVIGPVRIYIVQRGHSRYTGEVVDGEVHGQVEIVTMEQHTLGASFAPFAVNPTIHPVPAQSRFVLRPAGADEDCSSLRQAWDGSFGS